MLKQAFFLDVTVFFGRRERVQGKSIQVCVYIDI